MNIKVTYCTNYNGCDIEGIEGIDEQQMVDIIVDHAIEECSDDGEFYGDEDDLEEFIKSTVHAIFPEANVTVEFDHTSS